MKSVLLAAGVLILVGAIFVPAHTVMYLTEDILLALNPTAERAIEYGNRHFDATDPKEYDIDRAQRLYLKAEEIDHTTPGVQHQLARIQFLRGNLPVALSRADREIARHGAENPGAYYVRALIYGYMGRNLEAAADYEQYFKLTPANWAAINDYSWVLMKMGLYQEALDAIEWGLKEWPDNPWLLHNKVIALFELGRIDEAVVAADAAVAAVQTVSIDGWLLAYPGNDPLVAQQGLATFKQAVVDNAEKVKAAAAGEVEVEAEVEKE